MEEMERRLVELNEALLQAITQNCPTDPRLLDNAVKMLAGYNINTGSGNDVVIVNHASCPTPPPEGDPEPEPEPNHCDCSCKVVVISSDYVVEEDDCYIGVDSTKPVKITLPADTEEGRQIIIKAEMSPPIGNRKVTIMAEEPSTIDGQENYIITVSYKSISLLFHDGHWFLI